MSVYRPKYKKNNQNNQNEDMENAIFFITFSKLCCMWRDQFIFAIHLPDFLISFKQQIRLSGLSAAYNSPHGLVSESYAGLCSEKYHYFTSPSPPSPKETHFAKARELFYQLTKVIHTKIHTCYQLTSKNFCLSLSARVEQH